MRLLQLANLKAFNSALFVELPNRDGRQTAVLDGGRDGGLVSMRLLQLANSELAFKSALFVELPNRDGGRNRGLVSMPFVLDEVFVVDGVERHLLPFESLLFLFLSS